MTENVSNAELFAKLCEVAELLQANRFAEISENDTTLWEIQDIAAYFKVVPEHCRRWIVSDPRFPAAVDLHGRTGGKSKNLYFAGEVVRFCRRYRKKKAAI